MSVISTVLIFVIIPLTVIGVISALARTGSDRSRPSRRYRPGRPYDFAPVWFLANPDRVDPSLDGLEPRRRAQAPAIEAGIIDDPSGQPVLPGPVGGASDRW
ncbi:MAG TPA: hypothetical protein VFH03_18250 [Actinoplanes sp.]|nr:hypothetical protein [Actinoplanes sp.]